MHRLTIVLALLLAAASLPGQGAERGIATVEFRDPQGRAVGLYRESHALVIGAAEYRAGWPRLPGVKADVAAVAAALERQGFHVVTVLDPDRDALRRAFDDFIQRYGRGAQSRLLFYFAGHGHTLRRSWGGEMGYIVPVDASNPDRDPDGFLAKALDMQQVEVYAKRIDAKHALFVFDSCFSGSLFNVSRAVPESIGYKTARPVRQFITSGQADEQVPDWSVFRRQFVAALDGEGDTNRDGYVTGAELGDFLQQTVINYTYGAQHPQYGKIRHPRLDKGDFVLLAGGSVIHAPEPGPDPATGALRISTNPTGAAIALDGQPKGTAPLTLEGLPPGRVSVRAERPGYAPRRNACASALATPSPSPCSWTPVPPTAPSASAATPRVPAGTWTATTWA
jgi:hypothetical protein